MYIAAVMLSIITLLSLATGTSDTANPIKLLIPNSTPLWYTYYFFKTLWNMQMTMVEDRIMHSSNTREDLYESGKERT